MENYNSYLVGLQDLPFYLRSCYMSWAEAFLSPHLSYILVHPMPPVITPIQCHQYDLSLPFTLHLFLDDVTSTILLMHVLDLHRSSY